MSKTVKWIMAHVNHTSGECLTWPFGRDAGGYGRAFSAAFRTRLAHRIMCEMAHGPEPFGGAVARHTCGMGHLGCVNPRHLEWSTQAENVADRMRHGTEARGEATGVAVLDQGAVRQIRRMSLSGMSQRKIAAEIGCSHGAVAAVLSGRTWGHVQ